MLKKLLAPVYKGINIVFYLRTGSL